jgi:Cu+-exporting ATPase
VESGRNDLFACALTISNYLQKEGLKNIRVNPIDGQVTFDIDGQPVQEEKISNGIESLGYKVLSTKEGPSTKSK